MIFKSKPRITQYFSDNPDFYKRFGLWGHEGIDMVPTGSDWTIFAPFNGIITRKYCSEVYGETLIIQQAGKDISWRFAHFNKIYVKERDVVCDGNALGLMGNTPHGREGIGGPMGAHLHINCVPKRPGKEREYPDNGFKGRVDPLGVLWEMGEMRGIKG